MRFVCPTSKAWPSSSTTREGNKCARCWMILPEVGTISEYEDLCCRCADAVDTLQ